MIPTVHDAINVQYFLVHRSIKCLLYDAFFGRVAKDEFS